MKKKIKAQPAVEFATPGLLRLFAAMVYDTLLLAAISIAYGALMVGLRVLFQGPPEAGQRIEWGLLAGTLISAGWIVVLMGFYIYFWHKFGQTLGMKTWRVQLLDATTTALPTYPQCIKRSICAFASLIFLGAGYWYKFFNPQQKLLQDVVSKTRLVLLKKK